MIRTLRTRAPSLMVLAAAAAAGQAVAPPKAEGQVGVRPTTASDRTVRGWIGVNLEVTQIHGPEGVVESALLIRSVVEGSPAHAAKIRPGEVILRLNGQPATFAGFSRMAAQLSPGDRFRLTLGRSGEDLQGFTKTVTLEAAAKPAAQVLALRRDMLVRVDSALQRFRLVGSGGSVQFEAGSVGSEGVAGGALSYGIQGALPSGTTILTAVGMDSTQTVVLYPSGQIPTTWHREGADASVTRSGPIPDGGSYRFLIREPGGSELREEEVELQRLDEATDDLRRILGRIAAPIGRPAGGALRLGTSSADSSVGFRPLTPYIVGRNRVAGAELTTLNRELAAYFEVEGGLLVTDVAEDTPAAEAGLIPGDVVVRAGGVALRTVDALRAALSRQADGSGLALEVVRRGESIDLVLGRQGG